ncbi:MAG TPA: DUF3090 family protein [Acidimicrobiales bacterium]|nr:DUF3090 family protein [Acidimicrobiales bacterium]
MIHRLEHPERIAVGAIGDVGERLFLLQVREGRRLVVVKVEKDQVAILASWLARVVRSMARPEALEMDVELEPEYEIDLVAGEITVALDEEAATIDVAIEPVEEGGDSLFVTLTAEQAAAFAIRAVQLIEAGRPPCPLCGLPLDPRGHDCPRTNGHHAPIR